jgi:hypothetical protein
MQGRDKISPRCFLLRCPFGKDGYSHPGVFRQRARNRLKTNELSFCARQGVRKNVKRKDLNPVVREEWRVASPQIEGPLFLYVLHLMELARPQVFCLQHFTCAGVHKCCR